VCGIRQRQMWRSQRESEILWEEYYISHLLPLWSIRPTMRVWRMYIDLYNSKDETYYNFPDRFTGKLNSLIPKIILKKEKIFFDLIMLCFFKVQLILTRSYPDHASDKTWNVLENLTIHFNHKCLCCNLCK